MKKVLLFVIGILLLIPMVVKAEELDTGLFLYNGLYGNDVKQLQVKLNEIMSCDLEVDGIFGPLTENCVKRFQKSNGLYVDGIAGYKTISLLNSLDNYNNVSEDSVIYKIPEYVYITSNNLNVRSDAGVNNSVIAKVKRGNVYAVYGSKLVNGVYWYRINVNNKYGYINSKFVNDSFILVNKNNQRLYLYKDGELLLNAYVSIKKIVDNSYYNLYKSDIYKDNNVLDKLVGISKGDKDIIYKYIGNSTKIIVKS